MKKVKQLILAALPGLLEKKPLPSNQSKENLRVLEQYLLDAAHAVYRDKDEPNGREERIPRLLKDSVSATMDRDAKRLGISGEAKLLCIPGADREGIFRGQNTRNLYGEAVRAGSEGVTRLD